jgi:RNA 3'-terminal phosphate cyclase (ATP)
MGPEVTVRLERHGFYPAGGGRLRVTVQPAPRLRPLILLERGGLVRISAAALVARLPRQIAERELTVVGRSLGLAARDLEVCEVADSPGPGNAVMVRVKSMQLTEVFTGFGRKGIPAEDVAAGVAEEVRAYLDAGVPVGSHLADQLLLPLALAGGGAFRTLPLSDHAVTNLSVLRAFLPLAVRVESLPGPDVKVCLGGGEGIDGDTGGQTAGEGTR